jgi:periplasmic divalent cation tolerance protein
MHPTESRPVLVLTTIPLDFDGGRFAAVLVTERLAACVSQLPPMESVYRWEGALETASERQVLIKTTAGRVEALRERLHGLHPYDVPEFVVLGIEDGSAAYLHWLAGATTSG